MNNSTDPSHWSRWAIPLSLLVLCAPLWLHWGEPGVFLAINQACVLLPVPFWTGLSLLGNQVAEAMHYMHAQGFVHADMKPNNIVVTADGHAKIIDLGQSCPMNTIKERIQGTPDYIAPEQVHRRPITAKTDVYNLGATMYFVFTGKKVPTALATGDSLVSRLDDNLMERPKPARDLNKKIDQRLNDLIMQCVEIDPDKRPSDMKAVADRLNLILGVLRAKNSTEPPVDEGTASFQVG
jgi:serine/threonine-protein kinase